MTENVYLDMDDPIHSLLELATNGGYHIRSRVPDKFSLGSHSEPGIAATTGDDTIPTNVYTGPCLMSPVDSTALKQGYHPLTFDPETGSGEPLESYEVFADEFLLGGGIPKLSQIIDHWGIQGMDEGIVVLMLEDEEWTDKVARFLDTAGIAYDHDQVFADVRTAYGDQLKELFRSYVIDLLDNSVEIVPIFTSDYSEDIDEVLEEATSHPDVDDSYDDDDYYYQRIAMYTSPIWLDYLENELGLATGSLDISDPIRFYDEFYNYSGATKNIFRKYQKNYFAADNDDREREILFVPPLLSPHDKGYVLESHAPHATSLTTRSLDDDIDRLDRARSESYPNLLHNPISRVLTGFPNHADLARKLIDTYCIECDNRTDWKQTAISAVPEADTNREIQRGPGVKVQSRIQDNRTDVRTFSEETQTIIDQVYQTVTDDLRTLVSDIDED